MVYEKLVKIVGEEWVSRNPEEMINGLEVVLPNEEVCRVGSCGVSPYWFSRAPLPDLAALFIGWFARTGVVTKLGNKAVPEAKVQGRGGIRHRKSRLRQRRRVAGDADEVAEDITIWAQPMPEWAEGFQHTTIYITANSEEELELKKIIRSALRDYIKRKGDSSTSRLR